MPSWKVQQTNVKGEVDNFSMIEKHQLGEMNFPFDIAILKGTMNRCQKGSW
jgi:hypothetical protein